MSAPTAVLFDAPGPRARRRTLIASVVAAVLLLAVLALVVLRLAERGQLDAELWSPLINPSDEQFSAVWERIGEGLLVTLRAAFFAVLLSLTIGIALAAARLSLGRVARIPLIGVIELLRGLPVIVSILYVDILMRTLDVYQGSVTTLVIALTLYNSVIISEITRAGILSLPKGQVEAGLAVGLTRGQVMRTIQLPQAVRVMLPAIISQLIVILKDTALASIVLSQIDDLGRVADQLGGFLDNRLQSYFVVGLIYIAINLVLEQLAKLVQRRMSGQGRKRRTRASTAPDAAQQTDSDAADRTTGTRP
ncbi:amino acid ABC transporter permease [Kineococcus auxinigenes]|uniref:amino acid ABC transporter permease n=1 Tax=unclassified Kineococcus TaxID=2621656 RepID=UPI003D7DF229